MSIKNIVNKLIPSYAVLPLLSIIALNTITYTGTRMINGNFHFYDFSTKLDDMIPLCPAMVLFYVGAFIQWIICYLLIGREEKYFCYRYTSADAIAKLICLFFFLVYPTSMIRPEITGHGLFSDVLSLIYRIDEANNLFPSIHCLESWLCFRAVCHMKGVSLSWKHFNGFFTIGVCLSTVFCKQHVVVDILGGILAVEIGLMISGFILNTVKMDKQRGYRKEGQSTKTM